MMQNDRSHELEEREEKRPYETPAIIYSATISTRAGSPLSSPSGVDDIDPMDLFGE